MREGRGERGRRATPPLLFPRGHQRGRTLWSVTGRCVGKTVFRDAAHYKEKAESLSELASRTTSQVSQDVSSVLHKYTYLTPGTKAAVDGHQKSLRELDSARARVDELGSCRDVERRRRAETRFERATEQYVADDVRLVKAVQDIHDQKMQVIVVYFIDCCHRKHAFGEAFVSRNTCTQPSLA